jgi:hypothetical protein
LIGKKNAIVIDTSSLIEILENTKMGKIFFEIIFEKSHIKKYLLSPLVETELKYVFCRKYDFNEANNKINEFLKNFIIWKEELLRNEAAKLKCKYSISLANCYSIALAKMEDIPVYIKKEKEIEKIIKKLSIEVKINYIDDLVSEEDDN